MIYLLALISTIELLLLSVRSFHFWQLNGYKFSNSKKLLRLCAFQLVCGAVNAVFCYLVCLAFFFSGIKWLLVIYPLTSLLTATAFFFVNKPKHIRVGINFTKRFIRFLCAFCALSFALSLCLALAGNLVTVQGQNLYVAFLPIAFFVAPLVFVLSAVVVTPVEQAVARVYISGCKKMLNEHTDLIKIGVTGSYGKTSVKNILSELLSSDFKVYATPASFNTPMGICKSVALMPRDTDVFIAEMGAKHKGDIDQLCNIVKPAVAVITGIASQHLATFHSLQNIIDTKAELVEFVQNNNGFAVFNTDNSYCNIMYENCTCQKYRTGRNGVCFAQNISVGENGSIFDLCFENGVCIPCSTQLLGVHNISNIVLCASVAYKLGVSPQNIANNIEKLKPTEHRLQLVKKGDITIIDDGYNCNEEGAKVALDTLAMFDGRKIVICQGIVEQGKNQRSANFKLGSQIAKVADIAVLIGVNSPDLNEGLLSLNFDKKNIYIKNSLVEAQNLFSTIVKKGDVLLFMNDLPDNF